MAFSIHDYRGGAVSDRVHRVTARRHAPVEMPPYQRRSIGLSLDPASRQVTVGGHGVALTDQEFELLRVLVAGGGFVWSRELLIELAWRHDSYVTAATVDAVVASIRRKIERDVDAPRFILSAGDAGYRFADVE
jgi:DNA-binding response OmpR family regulator